MTTRSPEGFEIRNCRSCDAPVIWATTGQGKAMPVDAEPTEEGNVELTPGSLGRGPAATVLTGPALFSGPLRTSHFATCEQADEWRRSR